METRIRSNADREGCLCWLVRDDLAGRQVTLGSEAQRLWMRKIVPPEGEQGYQRATRDGEGILKGLKDKGLR
jgi:hypothetical protein